MSDGMIWAALAILLFVAGAWTMFVSGPRKMARRDAFDSWLAARRREEDFAKRYGPHHEAGRAWWAGRIQSHGDLCSEPLCVRPSRRIDHGEPFHLSHDHELGGVHDYLGPSHPECNEAEAIRRGVRWEGLSEETVSKVMALGARSVAPEPVPDRTLPFDARPEDVPPHPASLRYSCPFCPWMGYYSHRDVAGHWTTCESRQRFLSDPNPELVRFTHRATGVIPDGTCAFCGDALGTPATDATVLLQRGNDHCAGARSFSSKGLHEHPVPESWA